MANLLLILLSHINLAIVRLHDTFVVRQSKEEGKAKTPHGKVTKTKENIIYVVLVLSCIQQSSSPVYALCRTCSTYYWGVPGELAHHGNLVH